MPDTAANVRGTQGLRRHGRADRRFAACIVLAFTLAAILPCSAMPPAEAWQAAVEAIRVKARDSKVLPAEDAAGAVDGSRKGAFAFHTNQDASPWWQVDLGAPETLDRVVVYGGHCPERLAAFQVKLSGDGKDWQTAYKHTASTKGGNTFTAGLAGKTGRFVRIQVPMRTWMHISEIEVFGTTAPETNLALRRPASQSSVSHWSTRSITLDKAMEGPNDWQTDFQAGLGVLDQVADDAGPHRQSIRSAARELAGKQVVLSNNAWGALYSQAIAHADTWRDVKTQWDLVDLTALARALDYLAACFPESYPNAQAQKQRLRQLADANPDLRKRMEDGGEAAWEQAREMLAFQRKILLANPLLDFDRLLLLRRKAGNVGLPANWQSNCVLRKTGYDNDIAVLSPVTPDGTVTTLYKPEDDTFVGDVELHCDAQRLMFSKADPKKPWQVYELNIDGTGLHQISPDMGPDVNNYDPCYLPNGDVLYSSTAPMVAVPCVNGSTAVANLFRLNPKTGACRQLCFDQEHNWCPTVLANGRVLYLRWEYTDLPHSNSRILFHMNPDGTAQMEFYGSNSYWPNGVFYPRPIPGLPTQVVGIVTGHHGVRRMGELVIFDSAKGRREAQGVVQRIPGWGKTVEPVVKDRLVNASWPKFLHPYPLGHADGKGSGKFFLVSMQPTARSLWGIYLVDVFDNMLLLKELPGRALFEPIPLKPTQAPPVVVDKVDLKRKDGLVYLADIHRGPGLAGIPKGEVKALRIYTYVYGYRGMGGLYGTIGLDGPWDARRLLGTVPIESDGSALFRIPANIPVALQPLDKQGKALQIMRSWFTAMPGEVISCVGCHEIQNETPPPKMTLAARKPPVDLVSWYGKTRGFAFHREVQPVLDKHCIACHNGTTTFKSHPIFTLRGDHLLERWTSKMSGHAGKWGGKFSQAYVNLHRYVRHPGIESDMHLVTPMDFHADTSELVQILRKGHHGVELTPEEWNRITTWIDLNTPYHGDWSTIAGGAACDREKRRAEMRKLYAKVDEYHIDARSSTASPPAAAPLPCVTPLAPTAPPRCANWPLSQAEAGARQDRPAQIIDLGDGITMTFVYVPAGSFVMGSQTGAADERPPAHVTIATGFWLAETEVTNAQFARFDPRHDSRREHKQGYQFGVQGYPLNEPDQPVARVSWERAREFCKWLSESTGLHADLPTEMQWEYACRAGTDTPFSFGDLGCDFSEYANVADAKTSEFASNPYSLDTPIKDPPVYDDWLPKDDRFNDGALVSSPVGRYKPNAWGLHDMHGNVAEWTLSLKRPYPCHPDDGHGSLSAPGLRVVRGGSWRDRPKRCTSSYRLAYRPYQRVYNVGFRVAVPEDRAVLRGK